MAKKEHIEILKQGVKAWNKWRAENSDIVPDLSEASLIKADLTLKGSQNGGTFRMGDPSWEEFADLRDVHK